MKAILLNVEDGTYIVEKATRGSFPYIIGEVHWDEQNTLLIYSNNEKYGIQKLKEYAIKYHKTCIEELIK